MLSGEGGEGGEGGTVQVLNPPTGGGGGGGQQAPQGGYYQPASNSVAHFASFTALVIALMMATACKNW